jgi:hypothetical protein
MNLCALAGKCRAPVVVAEAASLVGQISSISVMSRRLRWSAGEKTPAPKNEVREADQFDRYRPVPPREIFYFVFSEIVIV